MEKRHGVSLGSAYQNVAGCRDMTQCISECIEGELREALAETKYFSILMDGSTDCAVVESELMYVLYVDKYGNLTQSFMKLNKVYDATAAGLTELLKDTMAEIIPGLGKTQYIVGFGADGASVNMGVRKGIAVRLQDEYPWLLPIHCFNHRLELAVKDALSKMFYDDIIDTLTLLYYFYHASGKRQRELQELANILENGIQKPKKCNGTRWIQHKLQATKALLHSYKVIVMHLEAVAADKTSDQEKAKGLIQKITTFKFVIHLLFFRDLLTPISRLSLAWQKDAVEIPQMLAAEKTMHVI